MSERIARYPKLMPGINFAAEKSYFKPKTPDELASQYYDEESKKPNGGNPVIKEILWLSGLTSPRGEDRRRNIEKVVTLLQSVSNSEFGLDKKDIIVERIVEKSNRNNARDPYTVDQSQFNSALYKEMLRPRQSAKAA